MRFHVLALPNAALNKKYSLDGFSQMGLRFCKILKNLGHHVIVYSSELEENDAPCDELVTVITTEERNTLLDGLKGDPTPYQYAFIEEWSPIWQLANGRTIREIQKRKQPGDFICIIGGHSQHSVADAHPDLMCVEYSIGYSGSFSPYRVFESQAWKHITYGDQKILHGRFDDAVIPAFFDVADFPVCPAEPFALYVGRLIPLKGIEIACRAAQAAGMPLKIIGHGDVSLVTRGAEYLGALEADERNRWMARAQVVLTPTLYLEPFNCVAVEAQMCGTPVIATDWGGFTETIEPGRTGFLCANFGQFVEALQQSAALDRSYIRQRAIATYSIEAVESLYRAYFDRLYSKHGSSFDLLGTDYRPTAETMLPSLRS